MSRTLCRWRVSTSANTSCGLGQGGRRFAHWPLHVPCACTPTQLWDQSMNSQHEAQLLPAPCQWFQTVDQHHEASQKARRRGFLRLQCTKSLNALDAGCSYVLDGAVQIRVALVRALQARAPSRGDGHDGWPPAKRSGRNKSNPTRRPRARQAMETYSRRGGMHINSN